MAADLIMTTPSSTSHGRHWLENFAGIDRELAALLIDSLRLVTYEAFRAGLVARLYELVATERIGAPALLLPVLGTDDVLAIAERESGEPSPGPSIAWKTFKPGRYLPGASGSEALISNVLRDIASSDPDRHWIAPGATPDKLAELECRSIVLVTDYAGSGHQVQDFAMTLVRNDTIRSWRSSKLIRIHVVSFAASEAAQTIFARKKCPVDQSSAVEIAPTLWDRKWSGVVGEEIEDLCRRYKGGSGTPFGHRRSGGLFASVFSAPNNLPAILRRPLDNDLVFLPYRDPVASFWKELASGHAAKEDFSDRMERIGQVRRATSERARRMSRGSRLVLDALAASRRTPSSPARLARELDLEMSAAEALHQGLVRLGLLSTGGSITDQGVIEHEAGKVKQRLLTAGLSGSDDFYYPASLR